VSQEDVELVRRVIAENRSDDLAIRMDSMLALWAVECEYVSILSGVEPQTYLGQDGIRRYFDDSTTAFARWRTDCDEAHEIASGTVFVTNHFHGIGKRSGAPVDRQVYGVFVISEARVAKAHFYLGRGEALKALGLEE
jgi:hypothetical protein